MLNTNDEIVVNTNDEIVFEDQTQEEYLIQQESLIEDSTSQNNVAQFGVTAAEVQDFNIDLQP